MQAPPRINAQQSRQHQQKTVVLTHCFLIASMLLAYFYCWGLELRPEGLIYPGCVMLVGLFIWEIWSWKKLTGHVFDPYALFLIAATLFNGGQAILEVLQLNERGILADRFSPQTIFKTLFLVSFGLAFLHLGALISAAKAGAQPTQANAVYQNKPSLSPQVTRWVGWGMLLISVPSVIILSHDAIAIVLSRGYFALYQRDATTGLDAGPRVLASFLVPAALFLLVSSKGVRTNIVVSAVLLFGYSAIQLFLGTRYQGFIPIVAYIWLWHRCIRPIPIPALCTAGAVVLFFVFPLISLTRNVSGAERLSGNYLINAFTSIESPGVAIISEMGGTMGTVAHTLELVPISRDYDLGIGYLYALATIVPNLFWVIHPTIAHGIASDWLTWSVDPYTASRGGGLGFSFIAEGYLNFGWFGTPLILGLIGFLYAKFLFWADRFSDAARLATVASFFAFFTFFSRGESSLIVRGLIWYSLAPYFLILLLSHLQRVTVVHGTVFLLPSTSRPNAGLRKTKASSI